MAVSPRRKGCPKRGQVCMCCAGDRRIAEEWAAMMERLDDETLQRLWDIGRLFAQ